MSQEIYKGYQNQRDTNPEILDSNKTTADFYTNFYLSEKSDSPDRSRINLAKRARMIFYYLQDSDLVLDLGSGRQIFQREYKRMYGEPTCRIISLDFANIPNQKLLVLPHTGMHIRGDGASLPLQNDSISAVVSNMALDFMPEKAREELFRVMKPGAHALINLHHPSLIPENLEELLAQKKYSKRQKSVYEFWKYLRDNNKLFSNPEQIKETFISCGLRIECITEACDKRDKWWEVDLVKPYISFDQLVVQRDVDQIAQRKWFQSQIYDIQKDVNQIAKNSWSQSEKSNTGDFTDNMNA